MDNKIQKLFNVDIPTLKKYVETEKLSKLKEIKSYLDDIYYNTGEAFVDDYKYDILKDTIIKRDPDFVANIGATLREGDNIVSLPYTMGSMDKIKPTDIAILNRWIERNSSLSYVVEDKLDGVSCLLGYENNEIKLYTRGDGTTGADISYLSPYFKISKSTKNIGSCYIRGELIMKKTTFEKKYKDKYANPRNLVSGRVNSKTVKEGLDDIEFVAYEIIQDDISMKPTEQLKLLKKWGFKIPNYEVVDVINSENLIQTYLKFKAASKYEIDGLIVTADNEYERNVSGNPKYSFAFKMLMGENVKKTTVEKVIWDVSRWGVIKPKIKIKPVMIDGNKITFTTGFNAKYISDNCIGPDTIVEITRSGDVIPYIVSIVKHSDNPQMPEDISYKWNDTKVDIITTEITETSQIKTIAHFFSKLGIKHVSQATVQKLYNNGYDTLIKIIDADKTEFEKIPGFGPRLAERTWDNIHNGLKDVSVVDLLGASGIFGYGLAEKKIKSLLVEIPEIFEIYSNMNKNELKELILSVKGFSGKSAEKVIENMKQADLFLKKISKYSSIKKTRAKKGSKFTDMKIVFSGFRDKDLEKLIVEQGGEVATSVSKNTSLLLVVDTEDDSGKIKKAKLLGINIMLKNDFKKKYFL